MMEEVERSIQEIKCKNCGSLLSFIREIADKMNSDFYHSYYFCPNCHYEIKIYTHEVR